jgi:hypothetical protein
MCCADLPRTSGDRTIARAMSSSAPPTVVRMNSEAPAGYSVRRSSLRLYGEAQSCAALSAMLLAIGLILFQLGVREMAALFIAVGVLFAWSAWTRLRAGGRFKAGAVAEERIGSRLWRLEEIGWLVEHDVQKGGGGNIDHLVYSPAVTFVIETKARRCAPRDLAQVLRHSEWAERRYLGGRRIVPVLCLQHSKKPPEMVDGVWEVGSRHLVDFLLDRG